MRQYCYIDLDDGTPFTSTVHGLERTENVRRDYRAEAVSVDAAVNSINRDFESEAKRDLFLPTRKDFERTSKSEREVDAKINEWNERHDNPTKGSGKYRPK